LSQRIFIISYQVSEHEFSSFSSIAKPALSDAPPVPGFSFMLFAHPEQPRTFLEVVSLPDPEENGQDASLEGYHFMSSYQPQRNTCLEVGTRIKVFQAERVAGEWSEDVDPQLAQFSALWAKEDGADLEDALKSFAEHGAEQIACVGLHSVEIDEKYGLLELFKDEGSLESSDGGLSDEAKSAKTVISGHIHKDQGSTVYVRVR